MNYKVVSSDDHLQETDDTWVKRVPSNLRDRVPRLRRTPDGDIWFIDGKPAGGLSLSIQAGHKFEEYRADKVFWEDARPGCYDPAERLKDMNVDGVDAQVLYPNVTLGAFTLDDLELQFACLRAYNDYLSEFCAADPARLIGIGLVPTDDMEVGVAELRRIAKLKGLRGAMLPTFPRGEPLNSSTYEPLWRTAAELGLPMHIHLRTGSRHTGALFGKTTGELVGDRCVILNLASLANYEALSRIIFGGVLERHPSLKFVSVEGNIGWLGYFLEKSDRTYKRHRHWTKLELPKPPSEYFHRQVYATFIEDKVGVMIRKVIGVDNLMWSSDYPHTDTTWPDSKKYIEESLAGVPEDDRYKILAGNAVKLYNLA
jgi:predicted TIM-barrel fold metal-dependent hydrolase